MNKTFSFKEDVIRIEKRKISTCFSYGERLKPTNCNKIFANSGRTSFNFVRKYNVGCHGSSVRYSLETFSELQHLELSTCVQNEHASIGELAPYALPPDQTSMK
jgi:hypothetical protein